MQVELIKNLPPVPVEPIYIEKPITKIVEVEKIIERPIITEIVKVVDRPIIIEKEKIVYREQIIETPVEKIIVKEVEKIVEVPIEIVKYIEVEKIVEKIVEVVKVRSFLRLCRLPSLDQAIFLPARVCRIGVFSRGSVRPSNAPL